VTEENRDAMIKKTKVQLSPHLERLISTGSNATPEKFGKEAKKKNRVWRGVGLMLSLEREVDDSTFPGRNSNWGRPGGGRKGHGKRKYQTTEDIK